jgi:sulfatase maturation enzyme AslB (radical SAM superfamily)
MIILQQAKDPALALSRAENLRSAVKANVLYTLIVEPSSKCNLACTFCDLHSGRIEDTDALKGQMSEQTFSRVIDQLASLPFVLKELQYHGNGEPLLNKNLPDFVRHAKDRGIASNERGVRYSSSTPFHTRTVTIASPIRSQMQSSKNTAIGLKIRTSSI